MDTNGIISSGLLELYVLGKTTELETRQVLAWKVELPEVAQEILAIENSLELLDFANAKAPTLHNKTKIFAAINNKQAKLETNTIAPQSLAPIKSINNNYKYAAAAAVALLIGSLLFNMSTYNKYTQANTALASSYADVAALQKQLDVPLNNFSQAVVLKGTATAPNSTAKIFWIKNTNEVYVEPSGLPDVPKGFQYQLWAIVDGKPVDAGMILYEKGKKYNIQKMKSFGKAQAFAITLEKEGGSPTPTMDKMYVMASI